MSATTGTEQTTSWKASMLHSAVKSNPNLFNFLGHLQHVTTESMHDMARMTNGLSIRRPKKKMNLMNETRNKAYFSRLDSGSYTRMQFLHAVSHSVGAHTDALQPRHDASTSDEDDTDKLPSGTALSATATGTTSTSPATRVATDPEFLDPAGSGSGSVHPYQRHRHL